MSKITKKKAPAKQPLSPKHEPTDEGPPSLSEHSKSININLTNSKAMLNSKLKVESARV